MSAEDAAGFQRRELLRRAVRPLAALAAVVVAGVSGFVAMAGVGLVEATFWLVDLTSVELYFQEHAGPATAVKAYAIVVRVGLVVAGLWVGETILAAAFGGQIGGELRRLQNERTIAEQDDHVVVCGYGMFGRTIAARLDEAGVPVVVVERDDREYRRALDDGHLAVQGDARRPETLEAAGVERARAVVAAIDDSNANLQIALVSNAFPPTVRVVARVGDEMYEDLARRAGADEVIIPEVLSGERVTEYL